MSTKTHQTSHITSNIRSKRLAPLFGMAVVGLLLGSQPQAVASLATYDITGVPTGVAGGFQATFLHAATGAILGSGANGAYRSGSRSSSLAGTLQGDLVGNTLSSIAGSITGTLGQLQGTFTGTTSTPFTLQLGTTSGGNGALAFETTGSGTGQFTGGYLDYGLFVNGSTTAADTGTFFFQPAAQMDGGAPLVPNRGNSGAFTLWGNNYMHDANSYTLGNWTGFLNSLGYAGGVVSRSGVTKPLGIDIYAEMTDDGGGGSVTPEPTTMVVWMVLAGIGGIHSSRRRQLVA